jgi:hypothetical protein
MSRRIFEFRCGEGHITEKYIDSTDHSVTCSVCQSIATRIISAPTIMLEGVTGDFPTAADAWARNREQKVRLTNKRNEG